ncbi:MULTISPECIES: 50S ribosomal protein L11 methyltransferase [unclassified Mucilaginibacter]|uniref:50S ribosomal protein L11 methyltransferase n=1 Tax=unclassified Mucilaginibacter TaxID=2617802 RepID=UPI002AC89CFA|nr:MULTISPECIES: 50S ribosomal protein L11 methyltransferase [unclassified Mucilaginibacter]MEB0260194.1 50S ribosomal protein L11 methyltransferase [Mucilaginibacter sp. 10I4]MEB0277395.1 50S ribosomal protein L11 methyltransferase [Mucilaginibacter sp. 10B2]MEB0300123.1 50S ribosomal protein L11 methyltransferase [Mucilaginibacter sp. 5C4]WPX25519.1 50S ribosomal protein L11 methyltransferase [Mucilaginibacter sp. 5C4]
MNYYELLFTTITTEDYQQDLLISALGDIGFDTFEELDLGFKAYIPVDNFNQELLDNTLEIYRESFTFSYDITLIPQKNWNEVWESNFEPIQIGDQVFVRATFHEGNTDIPHEIIIDPKMAFGTGHHQTTAMIMSLMLENDFVDKKVLDMGCGTGILAILAAKLGAKDITAIDYDDICYDSTIENSALNNISNIKALCGSKETIPDEQYDIILANINRNILLDQMERYAEVLKPDGEIYFSGFYEDPDLEIITDEARKYNLKYITHKKDKEWVAAKFIL